MRKWKDWTFQKLWVSGETSVIIGKSSNRDLNFKWWLQDLLKTALLHIVGEALNVCNTNELQGEETDYMKDSSNTLQTTSRQRKVCLLNAMFLITELSTLVKVLTSLPLTLKPRQKPVSLGDYVTVWSRIVWQLGVEDDQIWARLL